MDELTKRVYDFAKERLDGLTRWDGKTPVFEGHACIVADAVREYYSCSGPDLYRVALLHDVLEDTDTVFDELTQDLGLPYEEAVAVEALTHVPGQSWGDYLKTIARYWRAKPVKIFDMAHNYLDMDPKNKQRRQKYEASALALLYSDRNLPDFQEALKHMEKFFGHQSN